MMFDKVTADRFVHQFRSVPGTALGACPYCSLVGTVNDMPYDIEGPKYGVRYGCTNCLREWSAYVKMVDYRYVYYFLPG